MRACGMTPVGSPSPAPPSVVSVCADEMMSKPVALAMDAYSERGQASGRSK